MAKVWPQRAVAYGRVSTKKQEEGLDTQVFGITRLCENEGIELIGPNFADTGFGKTTLFRKRKLTRQLTILRSGVILA